MSFWLPPSSHIGVWFVQAITLFLYLSIFCLPTAIMTSAADHHWTTSKEAYDRQSHVQLQSGTPRHQIHQLLNCSLNQLVHLPLFSKNSLAYCIRHIPNHSLAIYSFIFFQQLSRKPFILLSFLICIYISLYSVIFSYNSFMCLTIFQYFYKFKYLIYIFYTN